MGEDREALEAEATAFAADNEITRVPITVPVEHENGPANFGINPDAEVSVMIYVGLKVKANHAFAEGDTAPAGESRVSETFQHRVRIISRGYNSDLI